MMAGAVHAPPQIESGRGHVAAPSHGHGAASTPVLRGLLVGSLCLLFPVSTTCCVDIDIFCWSHPNTCSPNWSCLASFLPSLSCFLTMLCYIYYLLLERMLDAVHQLLTNISSCCFHFISYLDGYNNLSGVYLAVLLAT